jgi:hypothetical protein
MLTFNSYPRSGNVFFSVFAGQIINTEISAIHDPDKYSEKGQIAIFRNPYESIASRCNRNAYGGQLDLNVTDKISEYVQEYVLYVQKALENKDALYICDFESMKKNPEAEAIKIAKHFGVSFRYNKDAMSYTENFMKEGLMTKWDGHMPREKDEMRLKIEDVVNKSSQLELAYSAYKTLEFN